MPATVDRSIQFKTASVAAGTTDSVLVAGASVGGTGAKVRVVSFVVAAAAATPAASIVFNSKPAGAGTAISPVMATAAGQTIVGDSAPFWESNKGEGLSVTTGAGTNATTVSIAYTLVT
jgi:hypothetical protein